MKINKILTCGLLCLSAYVSAQPSNTQPMSQVEALRQLTALTQNANKSIEEIKKSSNPTNSSINPKIMESGPKIVQIIKMRPPMSQQEAENKVVDLAVEGSLVMDDIKNTPSKPKVKPR